MFKPVNREQNKLRLALDGPAGSGKTYTALAFANAIAKAERCRIAFIDTEHKSASLYAGENGWWWDGVDLESFAPSTYTAVIKGAAAAGYGVLVIDSLSHAWAGTGGALAQVDKADGRPGGKFGAWRDVTPAHNQMIDQIRQFPGHVIVCMRTKMEYSLEEDAKGKKRVEKLGTRPIQREGVEYEFDIVADMDIDHRMTVSKTRFSGVDGDIVHKPDGHWLAPVMDWLKKGTPMKAKGVAPAGTSEETARQIKEHWRSLKWPAEKLKRFLAKHEVSKITELSEALGKKLLERVEKKDREQQAKETF